VDRPSRSVRLALGSVGPTIVRGGRSGSLHRCQRRLGDRLARRRCRPPLWRAGRGGRPADRRPPLERGPTGDMRSASLPAASSAGPSRERGARTARARVTSRSNTPSTTPLRVNGADHEVRDAWAGESLLYVLRERLGLFRLEGRLRAGRVRLVLGPRGR
jgi:hypothetical protein